MLPESRDSRIVINPIEDCLLLAGRKYLEMVGYSVSPTAKSAQFALFLELLEDRLDNGESFEWPSDEDLPTEQLLSSDTITEGQSIKLVGAVVKDLEARRRARY